MANDEKLAEHVRVACEVILKRTSNPTVADINRETLNLCEAVVRLRELVFGVDHLPFNLRAQVVESLRTLLMSVSNQVLLAASYLLGDMKALEAIPDLVELLKSDAESTRKIDFWADPFGQYEESVQEIGCNALVRMKAIEAILEIEKRLQDPDQDVREFAAKAVQRLRS